MKLGKLALAAAWTAGSLWSTSGVAQTPISEAVGTGIAQVSHCGECGSCDQCQPACNDGCEDWSAMKCTTCGDDCDGCLECNIGEPVAVLGSCGLLQAGGWVQLGYHDNNLTKFNSRKNDLQLQQAWFWAERAVPECGGIGGRIDYIYGTDGPDTQAFGIDNDHWDNGWDHGPDYGHAIPQAYLELGYGDFSAKVGHFYTIIGYEVVQATGNFFYSHAYTMYNSEPFTHTGALITYDVNEDIDLYGGYVLGWDSGFEDNGDAVIGGASVQLTDDISMTYAAVGGRFADNLAVREQGYMQSIVTNVTLTDTWQYVFQNDWLDTEDPNGVTLRDTVGINQYLIHQLNDCWGFGARFEWWHVENDSIGYYGDNAVGGFVAADDFDIYALTLGLNYKPCANVIVRPEIRWDWVNGRDTDRVNADFIPLENNDDDQTTFGVDSIFLF